MKMLKKVKNVKLKFKILDKKIFKEFYEKENSKILQVILVINQLENKIKDLENCKIYIKY